MVCILNTRLNSNQIFRFFIKTMVCTKLTNSSQILTFYIEIRFELGFGFYLSYISKIIQNQENNYPKTFENIKILKII